MDPIPDKYVPIIPLVIRYRQLKALNPEAAKAFVEGSDNEFFKSLIKHQEALSQEIKSMID